MNNKIVKTCLRWFTPSEPETARKFWFALRAYASAQLSELKGASTKCSCCNQWEHELLTPTTWELDPGDDPSVLLRTCPNCGNTSRWLDTGFMGLMHCLDPDVSRTPPIESIWAAGGGGGGAGGNGTVEMIWGDRSFEVPAGTTITMSVEGRGGPGSGLN